MALFEFKDDSLLLGTVREVDTRKVSIHVKTDGDLRKAKVGQLVALQVASGVDTWLIAFIDKVMKSVATKNEEDDQTSEKKDTNEDLEKTINSVKLTLVGSTRWNAVQQKPIF